MKKIIIFCCLTLVFFSCRKVNTDPGYLPNSYSDQQIGASANDLLSAAKYTSVSIEVQYMPGYKPEDGAITNITDYLNMLCNKPGGINITQTQVAANSNVLDPEKVAILEKQNRTAYTSGATLALYILITDNTDTSVNTLGFAYRNTSICLFGQTIFNNSGKSGQLSRTALESSVLEHELGHILGLVNTGTPMVVNHEDTAHSKHCINPACLMYYATDINSLSHFLHPNAIATLDSNCRNDLHANGGK